MTDSLLGTQGDGRGKPLAGPLNAITWVTFRRRRSLICCAHPQAFPEPTFFVSRDSELGWADSCAGSYNAWSLRSWR